MGKRIKVAAHTRCAPEPRPRKAPAARARDEDESWRQPKAYGKGGKSFLVEPSRIALTKKALAWRRAKAKGKARTKAQAEADLFRSNALKDAKRYVAEIAKQRSRPTYDDVDPKQFLADPCSGIMYEDFAAETPAIKRQIWHDHLVNCATHRWCKKNPRDGFCATEDEYVVGDGDGFTLFGMKARKGKLSKRCSEKSFQQNVRECIGTKSKSTKQCVAIAYSTLHTSCGVPATKKRATPKQIVRKAKRSR